VKRSLAPWAFALLSSGIASPSPRTATAASLTKASDARRAKITIGRAGFEPSQVAVPLGPVALLVEATEGDHCFAIPSLDIERRVRPGRPIQIDLSFDAPGEVPFNCCVDPGEKGAIVVARAGRPKG
jgi:plastocyanin